ncbi:MAG: flagellar basal body rod protein FlgC [Alphaproteobacteria bacterium]|nr:MAG: flagellar basal body rod protein FlgC [Alphaproteobacteria bacterium]TAE81236.1 MAG: flagellar basal body rod protein FlgC [Alphaproteobacteria bacterium]TAF15106.1 MAG: flagellar basal body rod protein FlgC [Alphaproteobacteria bacterium]TAF39040.1 MAG: flagellar basal body rod protein FlgC [Alphaproteobacteria bacterium]TAF76678.1 MAG: flagellar basal body rod protein FlgC [Alphaproteobacteria bacterium]
MVDLVNSMYIAASGMKAQSDRLRVVAQNMANVDTTGELPGSRPYARKVLSFKNHLDRDMDADMVEVNKYGVDKTPFPRKFDPGHPASDNDGYVLMPNVNPVIEMVDMKEARRAYEANLNMVEVSKSMLMRTVDLLR